MKKTTLLLSASTLLVACAPRMATAGVTITPVVYQVTSSAAPGQEVTILGRYLGGPKDSAIYVGATLGGHGGIAIPPQDVVRWTSSEIIFKLPPNLNPGGGFLFVDVGSVASNTLPFSVSAPGSSS
jgi:hypothetical protein